MRTDGRTYSHGEGNSNLFAVFTDASKNPLGDQRHLWKGKKDPQSTEFQSYISGITLADYFNLVGNEHKLCASSPGLLLINFNKISQYNVYVRMPMYLCTAYPQNQGKIGSKP